MRRCERRRSPHDRPSAGRGRPQAAVEAGAQHAARDPERDHLRLAVGGAPRVLMIQASWKPSPHPAASPPTSPASGEVKRKSESGQVLIIVAVWLVALVGSA